ncbi:hypothetical protein [Uliginosibacterium gangwonense]|uniref:hypothetical protein n=1 Tax=Uliginosibacterium gangwonense TaxID=392736 RepID=UPI00036D2C28|nr:hypothetical protein [Uliginosibacterium gangwonense]
MADNCPHPAWLDRLRHMWQAFRAWRQRNTATHAQADAGACCAKPPPGAGKGPQA